MVRYEALMLAVPTITQDEIKNIESHLDKVVKKDKGEIISFERWGKYRLAFPVKKNDYGIYFLARFEAEESGSLIEDIRSLFVVSLGDTVMRAMISELDPEASLAYHRPQSLEEIPTEKVGAFLQERSNELAFRSDEEDDDLDDSDDEDMNHDEEN